jgi:hypothetical protein
MQGVKKIRIMQGLADGIQNQAELHKEDLIHDVLIKAKKRQRELRTQ